MQVASVEQQQLIPSDLIPENALTIFMSPMLSRKERIAMLVKWFMVNYHIWDDVSPEAFSTMPTMPMSIAKFADALTRSLSIYGIQIQQQRVWTWIKQRNLPREDNFNVMANVGTGWQREFATIVLSILASTDPDDTPNRLVID